MNRPAKQNWMNICNDSWRNEWILTWMCSTAHACTLLPKHSFGPCWQVKSTSDPCVRNWKEENEISSIYCSIHWISWCENLRHTYTSLSEWNQSNVEVVTQGAGFHRLQLLLEESNAITAKGFIVDSHRQLEGKVGRFITFCKHISLRIFIN